jgi:hypothetical protein
LLNNNQASVMGLPIVGLQIRDNWGVWRPPSEGEDQLNTVLGNNRRSTCRSEEVKLPLSLIKYYTMKTCGELEVTAPRIVNFGTRMRRIVSYTPPATSHTEIKNKPPRSAGWVGLRVASNAAKKLVPVKAVKAWGEWRYSSTHS